MQASQVFSVADWLEALYQVAVRLRAPTAMLRLVLDIRSYVFDAKVAKLASRVGRVDKVITRSTASLRTTRAYKKRGSRCLLDYPIVHHRYLKQVLVREAELYPELRTSMVLDVRSAWMERRLDREIEESHLVLNLSRHQELTFVAQGVHRGKLAVAELGVDTNLFGPAAGGFQGRDLKELLFVGQLTQRKGIAYLLKILEALPSDFHLVVVGSGRGRAKEFLEGPRVTLLDPMPRTRLAEFYRRSGVFIFPSLGEGFPQTPLEAMSCGLPVVASHESYGEGGPILDGVNGFLRHYSDSAGFAEAVMAVTSDKLAYDKMSHDAIRTARRYTWARFSASVNGL